jgi:hypothetical protein
MGKEGGFGRDTVSARFGMELASATPLQVELDSEVAVSSCLHGLFEKHTSGQTVWLYNQSGTFVVSFSCLFF